MVITLGTYSDSPKSASLPTGFHLSCVVCSNIGATANPSAGSPKAALATPPTVSALSSMKRRRVTVSPSKAAGMPRSAAYGDLLVGLRSVAIGGAGAGGGGRAPPQGYGSARRPVFNHAHL